MRLQAVTSGANPVNIKRGIDKTCAFLVDRLQENAVPVSGSSDIRSVATISAGNDAVVGAMIAEALDKVPGVRPVSDCCCTLYHPYQTRVWGPVRPLPNARLPRER